MSKSVNTNTFFLNPFAPKAGTVIVTKPPTNRSALPYWRLERPKQPHINIGRISREAIPQWLKANGISYVPEDPRCANVTHFAAGIQLWFQTHQAHKQWSAAETQANMYRAHLAHYHLGKVRIADITPQVFTNIKEEIHRKLTEENASGITSCAKDVLLWLSRNNVRLSCNPHKLNTACLILPSISLSVKKELQLRYPETYLALRLIEETGWDLSCLEYIRYEHLEKRTNTIFCVGARISIYETTIEEGKATREHVIYGDKIAQKALAGDIIGLLVSAQYKHGFIFSDDIASKASRELKRFLNRYKAPAITLREIKEQALIRLSKKSAVVNYEYSSDEDIEILFDETDQLLSWFEAEDYYPKEANEE